MTTEQRADAIEKQGKIAAAKLRVTQKFVAAVTDAEAVRDKVAIDAKTACDKAIHDLELARDRILVIRNQVSITTAAAENKAEEDLSHAHDRSRAVSLEYESAAKKLQDLLIGAEVLA